MSNGKGFVANNPSYDGWGVSIGVAHSRNLLMKKQPVPVWKRRDDTLNNTGRWHNLLQYQKGRVGTVSEQDFDGAALSTAYTFSSKWAVQLDTSFDEIAGYAFRDVGLQVITRDANYSHSIYVRRRDLSDLHAHEIGFHTEWHQNDFSSIGATYGYEDRNLEKSRHKGGIFVRLYPIDGFVFRSGISVVEDPESATELKDIDIDFAFEYQPDFLKHAGFSLYLEYNTETQFYGFRYNIDSTVSMRHRDRTALQRNIRF